MLALAVGFLAFFHQYRLAMLSQRSGRFTVTVTVLMAMATTTICYWTRRSASATSRPNKEFGAGLTRPPPCEQFRHFGKALGSDRF